MEDDKDIIEGLKSEGSIRARSEKALYNKFNYFIREGSIKHGLSEQDSFSAYSDSILATIHNIVSDRFEQAASLKTYLFRIFSNKCVDIVRKSATNKEQSNQTANVPELLTYLPDNARSAVESMISRQKRAILQEHLQKLGDKCREILLFFEDGYSDREIAEKLDYNTAAVVKTTRLRCLGKLKERISQIIDSL